jgi:hypothetical protein
MIGVGILTMVFEVPLGERDPDCVDVVASACWAGYRLLRPPAACLENVVLGCRRLPQFREAARSSLRREMRWHFRASRVSAFGEEGMTLGRWRERWDSDSALRRTVEGHPAFPKWRAGLLEALRREPLVALAEESGRSCYGALGGDAMTLGAMHRMMEEGF